MLENIA